MQRILASTPRENDKETLYQKDCSQGLAHVHKDLFLIQIKRLSTNIKLTLYKALIRSVTISMAENGKHPTFMVNVSSVKLKEKYATV
jgi:hypothetical protein